MAYQTGEKITRKNHGSDRNRCHTETNPQRHTRLREAVEEFQQYAQHKHVNANTKYTCMSIPSADEAIVGTHFRVQHKVTNDVAQRHTVIIADKGR